MHTTVEYTEEETEVVDETIDAPVARQESAKKVKEMLVKEADKTAQEFKSEHTQIRNACNEFGCFLARNGIVTVNTAFEQ